MPTPQLSSKSSSRAARICGGTRSGGYQLKGMATISASCPAARNASRSPSACISAPPRTNGTCTVAIATRIDRLFLRTILGEEAFDHLLPAQPHFTVYYACLGTATAREFAVFPQPV